MPYESYKKQRSYIFLSIQDVRTISHGHTRQCESRWVMKTLPVSVYWVKNRNSVTLWRKHSDTLQRRHNGRDGDLNHQPHDYILNRLFRRRSKKTSKLRVTGLCAGNSTVTGEFPAEIASYAEIGSIWWRHHEMQNRRTLNWYFNPSRVPLSTVDSITVTSHGRHGHSNHRQFDCLFNRLFTITSK